MRGGTQIRGDSSLVFYALLDGKGMFLNTVEVRFVLQIDRYFLAGRKGIRS